MYLGSEDKKKSRISDIGCLDVPIKATKISFTPNSLLTSDVNLARICKKIIVSHYLNIL